MPWTIYCHTHTDSGRRYIGLTSQTMERRWAAHLSKAKTSKDGRWHFPNAIRKYGKDAFAHEVLEVCHDLKVANLAEECWIELFETRDLEKGFNLARGGKHVPHPIKDNPWLRPGFRERAVASALASLSNPTVVANRAAGVLKAKVTKSSPASKAIASARAKEKWSDPHFHQKISESSKKLWEDPEYRASMESLWDDPTHVSRCSIGLSAGTNILKSRTECPAGHEYSVENTYVDRLGTRKCRSCHNAKSRARSTPSKPPPALCSNGHTLTPDLIFLNQGNWRCKVCNRARVKEYYRAKRCPSD